MHDAQIFNLQWSAVGARRLQNCLSELRVVMGHESSFWDALTVHVIRGLGGPGSGWGRNPAIEWLL